MIEMITGAVIAVLVVFICLYCYRRGVKDGMAVKNNVQPEPIKVPKKQPKLTKEQKEEQKKIQEQMEAILNYTPEQMR